MPLLLQGSLAPAHEEICTKQEGLKLIFSVSSAMLSCNDICPSKELPSLLLFMYQIPVPLSLFSGSLIRSAYILTKM